MVYGAGSIEPLENRINDWSQKLLTNEIFSFKIDSIKKTVKPK